MILMHKIQQQILLLDLNLFTVWESRVFVGLKPILGNHLWTLFSHIFLTGANRISFPVHHFLAADVFRSVWWSWRTNAKFCNRLVILTAIMGT